MKRVINAVNCTSTDILLVYVRKKSKTDPIIWIRAKQAGLIYEVSPGMESFLHQNINKAKKWCDSRFHRKWQGRDIYPWLRRIETALEYDPVPWPAETPKEFRQQLLPYARRCT